MDLKFDQWLNEIDRLARAEGNEGSYTKMTGADAWIESYNDGMSPADAWYEEKASGL